MSLVQYSLFENAELPSADTAKSKIELYCQIARERGGECLSIEYKNDRTKLRFRCGDGHEWETSARSIKAGGTGGGGTWCPKCNNRFNRRGLEEAKNIAITKGGLCLSDTYISNKDKLLFICKNGHSWAASLSSVKNNLTWCPVCCGNIPIDPLGKLQEIAKERGGDCLSTEYKNKKTKLRFLCSDGHIFEAERGSILAGRWCPQCVNKTEALVRQFMESVFHAPFPSKSPEWLQRPDMPRRVLDGYNEALGMAFEYHGIQHYQHVKHFHGRSGSRKTLSIQIMRDNSVRQICAEYGVKLIEIKTLPDGYGRDQFVSHVSAAIEISTGIPVTEFSKATFSEKPFCSSKLEEMRKLALGKDGECLSVKYISLNSKLRWRCTEGHEWEAIPKSIKKGHWCPYCNGKLCVDPLNEIRRVAESKGGECLSNNYINSQTKLRFRCDKGHEWDAAPDSIKGSKNKKRNGSWCAVCAGLRISDPLGDIQKIAELKGGKCLSSKYKNTDTKLKFRCSVGHEWDTTAHSIKAGHWCHKCACVLRGKKISETRKLKINGNGTTC